MKQNKYGLSDENIKKLQRTKELGERASIILEKYTTKIKLEKEEVLATFRKFRKKYEIDTKER